MIIEVRTRTVGYKACVKNSLSFSTLPTKPFPRWKDRAFGRTGCLGAGPQPKATTTPQQTNFSIVVRLYLHQHTGVL